MAYVVPTGSISWEAPEHTDILYYHIYVKEADTTPPENTVFDRSNVVYMYPAQRGKQSYSMQLTDLYGLLGTAGGHIVIGVAAQDAHGNVSEVAGPIAIPLTATPPAAPGSFTYTPPSS